MNKFAKSNFSKNDLELFDGMLDLTRCNYSGIEQSGITREELENNLRDRINRDVLGGLTLYQAMRRNHLVLYEILEEIVNVTISENVFDSPFVNLFCEIKNRGLGDKTAFYSEGGLVSVARFAGNHWDTNREAIDVGDEITLPKEWIYVHVYEDLERFLLGIGGLERIMDKIRKSVVKYFNDRIYAQFTNVATCVPTEFQKSGNSVDAVGELADIVQAAGGYSDSDMIVAGTRSALRKLTTVVPDGTLAETQKQAMADTGSIGTWEGRKLMIIPQTLKSGTFDLALNKNQLFILGGDTKPIKVEIYGDTRSKIDTEGKINNDQSVDIQLQTKLGMGLVLPQYFGVFTFA